MHIQRYRPCSFCGKHGIRYGRRISFLGRNVLLCVSRYDFTFSDSIRGEFVNSIYLYARSLNDTATLGLATLLNETLKINEGPKPRGQHSLTNDDLNFITNFLCAG